MFSLWQLGSVALAYVLVLFVIAWWGDRSSRGDRPRVNNAWTYSLALGVYCTSWTFYGAVGEAAQNGWNYLPIYLGPIVTVIFGAPMVYKMVSIARQHHITSIADFLASRYGKSRHLAVLVTLVAVIGVLPYIALQLKAVTLSFENILVQDAGAPLDTAFVVAVLMALFTLLFGTRHIDATEHQSGLMLAVSFESFVKLVAFVAVGLFCLFVVYDGPLDLWRQAWQSEVLRSTFEPTLFAQGFVTVLLLSMVAIICLPRQFHAGVVENNDLRHLRTTRWLLPTYLALFAIFVLPIVATGVLQQPELIARADTYMLSIPSAENSPTMVLLTFIGGIAAATGMVIVSTIALAIMLTNEVLMPLWVQYRIQERAALDDLGGLLRMLRRISVVILLALAFVFLELVGEFDGLASIGLMSFAAVAQFAPALFGGLYWRGGHHRGATAGLAVGFLVWAYCLLLPSLLPQSMQAALNDHGLFGLGILRPNALFGIEGLEPLSHAVFWSLALNLFAYVYFSRRAQATPLDEAQATRFVDMPVDWWREGLDHPTITTGELLNICKRSLGDTRSQTLLVEYMRRRNVADDMELPAPLHLVRYVERLLAGAMGASTARIVMASLLREQSAGQPEVIQWMDEASELIQFNHQLLRTTIETISQGICVVDRELRIVAWNQAYVKLFNYPEGLIRLGRPIRDVYRFNAERGFYSGSGLEDAVDKRVNLLRNGTAHQFERVLPNEVIVEVRGMPMAGGGFVSTYLDITERKRDEMALREINENLEQMVNERTRRLSELNLRLAEANEGKTRFLAAAGHDLMQPLNAAQLFASSLRQSLAPGGDVELEHAQQVLGQIDSSLRAAEQIIFALLEISKLDTGTLKPNVQPLCLAELMNTLGQEFSALANASGLQFDVVPSNAWVQSDAHLLRRVLQNFLSNAVRYTEQGRILFGCRRVADGVRLEVWDTGPGIPEEQHEQIFREFHSLSRQGREHFKGLGLGLAIADRICRLLGHPCGLRSWPGRGTVFSVTVPVARNIEQPPATVTQAVLRRDLAGLRVLCVDNDSALLAGLVAVLEGFGCEVLSATGLDDARRVLTGQAPPDIVLVDYQLDDEDGFDVINALDAEWDEVVPAVLMTADRRGEIRERALEQGLAFLQKPITDTALREMLERL